MVPQWDDLERRKTAILSRSLAISTLGTYRTGIKQYLEFCSVMRISPVPLVEGFLENFVVALSSIVGHKTIKVYLAGVQYWSKLQGCNLQMKKMHRLKYVLSGVLCSY